jgi:hypothetical protein
LKKSLSIPRYSGARSAIGNTPTFSVTGLRASALVELPPPLEPDELDPSSPPQAAITSATASASAPAAFRRRRTDTTEHRSSLLG